MVQPVYVFTPRRVLSALIRATILSSVINDALIMDYNFQYHMRCVRFFLSLSRFFRVSAWCSRFSLRFFLHLVEKRQVCVWMETKAKVNHNVHNNYRQKRGVNKRYHITYL